MLGDVALYRARNEKTDRATGCDAGADGGGRDVEAGDALKAQHVPRLVNEPVTVRIVPKGLPSRKRKILGGEIGGRRPRHHGDVAQGKECRMVLSGLEVEERKDAEGEDEARSRPEIVRSCA